MITWIVSFAAVVGFDVLLWLGRRSPSASRSIKSAQPWPRPGRGGARHALAGVWPWLVLILVVLAWEILGIDTGKHVPHLTISALTQAFRALNAAMLLVWMLVGVGYGVARARGPAALPGAGARTGRAAAGSSFGVVLLAHPRAGFPALLLPASRPAGVAFWLGLVGAAVVVDVLARRSKGRIANSEEFLRFITTSKVANCLLVVAWAYAGYHIFAR